jgi:hypothetical protein
VKAHTTEIDCNIQQDRFNFCLRPNILARAKESATCPFLVDDGRTTIKRKLFQLDADIPSKRKVPKLAFLSANKFATVQPTQPVRLNKPASAQHLQPAFRTANTPSPAQPVQPARPVQPPTDPLQHVEPVQQGFFAANTPAPTQHAQPLQPAAHLQPIQPVQPGLLAANTPAPTQPAQPEPGFLPAEQWGWIQSFHKAMAAVEMETCSRCQERWFEMDLKHNVCHRCFNRDKGNKMPFLMSADNEMNPGELPAHLPELTQVDEMIIARSHVQMLVHRYRGH